MKNNDEHRYTRKNPKWAKATGRTEGIKHYKSFCGYKRPYSQLRLQAIDLRSVVDSSFTKPSIWLPLPLILEPSKRSSRNPPEETWTWLLMKKPLEVTMGRLKIYWSRFYFKIQPLYSRFFCVLKNWCSGHFLSQSTYPRMKRTDCIYNRCSSDQSHVKADWSHMKPIANCSSLNYMIELPIDPTIDLLVLKFNTIVLNYPIKLLPLFWTTRSECSTPLWLNCWLIQAENDGLLTLELH